MKVEQIREIRALLASTRLLALSVTVKDELQIGLLPFVVLADYSGVLIHASALARHTRGLSNGALCALLIHRPDQPDIDPLQIPRLSLQCSVELIEKGTEAYAAARQRYLKRFLTSEITFQLGDFNLYRLRFTRGRYVGGFASAVNIGAAALRELANSDD